MTQVAVATTSQVAADAAAQIVAEGGNAVDAALCASLLTMNTEPGVCALAGGAFVTIWPVDAAPVTFDGYVAVPGLASDGRVANAGIDVSMQYGGGITTTIGAASVAVPGSLAAVSDAAAAFGNLPLAVLMQPSIDIARSGFPLSSACHHYLEYSGKPIFGRDPVSRRALHPNNDTLLDAGELVHLPGLADTLQAIADEGPALFYKGELGARISRHILDAGGVLTREDLASYQALRRDCLQISVGDWEVALNPPPAIGGTMLGALLLGMTADESLLPAMRASLQYRRRQLDFSTDLSRDCQLLLDSARTDGALLGNHVSGATVHTSAVDSDGMACAITASAGYGSGEMPAGTGLWLNNCLGELELNRRGLSAAPAGLRLPSNMAPTTARSRDQVLAIGSPGADRITSAMAQTLQQLLLRAEPLDAAISAPRLHVEVALEADEASGHYAEILCTEPGALVEDNPGIKVRAFDTPSMYFGGVGAALALTCPDAAPVLSAAADPRRTGGVCVVGTP
ncbi:MAG: gamma-glutamyltransferase [Pseudomonadota bacterium]